MKVEVEVKQGQIILNAVWQIHQTCDMICFEVDCKSKYPEYVGGGDTDLYFRAQESSLYCDRAAEYTKIKFTLPDSEEGWRSFVDAGVRGITIAFVRRELLVHNEYVKELWRN